MALSFVGWQRSGFQRSIGLLEILRIVLVAMIGVLLNQPEWVEQFRPRELPTVLVLHDQSQSMETQDVVSKIDTGGTVWTRTAAAEKVIDPGVWQPLSERFDVVIQPFSGKLSVPEAESSTVKSSGTDICSPLNSALKQHPNLRAIVLVSDGDWNTGSPPVQAATALRLQGIPVLGITVGSIDRLPDIELLSFDVPTFGIVNKTVRLPFSIDSSLPRDVTATIKLTASNGVESSKELRIAAMSRTIDAMTWKPTVPGEYTLTLDVPPHAGELLEANNRLTAPISIREEKLRVLIVESVPRWEYRYLRNALSRDVGVDVSCLLFHPGLSKLGGGNKDYIARFPKGLDELSVYDVVFLGDVGVAEDQLTVEQCRLLKGLVEHQASGLVFMPGLYGRQHSLLDTPLEELYPVVLDPAQPTGWGSRTPNQFELTDLGRRSLLTKLADTPEQNVEVWENLPGFQWYAPVLRSKPGSDVLCVHHQAANQYGRLPLLATRTFGTGKVLFMGTDGAWRWRKGVEDLYHYRFWGQVVRWMAYQRHIARGETMRMFYSPEQPQVSQMIAITANVMQNNGEPLSKGDVTARFTAPSGDVQTIRFIANGEEWGEFSSKFTAKEPGAHQVVVSCRQTNGSLETSLFVQGGPTERIGRPARPEILEEIARVTGGQMIAVDRLEEAVNRLATMPEPPAVIRRVQLWSHPAMAGFVIVLLGIFWVGRKMVGMT